MNKDVIYIDTEDDITGIIGRVKAAGTKIVAIVPPKRIGILQSVVNLKLLQRAAQEADKRVVLITNDRSLTTLAAGVKIPVAKNLQSRPEIPQLDMPESPEEEIINGKELPVGDVAKSLTASPIATDTAEEISKKVEIGTAAVENAKKAPTPPSPKKIAAPKGPSKFAVPNFNQFRKRLFLFGGLGILLIAFFVWAIAFAPRAIVTISAKTTNVNIERFLTLDPTIASSDTGKFVLKPVVQQLKKAVAAEFQATGTKDIGDRAKGNVTVTNSFDSDPVNVPAGTTFTAADGHKFTSNAAITIPGATVAGGSIHAGSATVGVTAVDIGPDYNIAAQSYTVQGYGGLAASGDAMAGGSKQTVTVISQEDVDKAKQQLGSQNVDAAKAELKKQFNADTQIIEESYSAEQSTPSVSPAIGERATTAKLTVETTYMYVGLARSDIRTMLTDALNEALKDKTDQQNYSTGEGTIVFQTFEKNGAIFKTRLVTTGQIGPKIDTRQLARQLVGKRSGEIQAVVNQISGVNNVDVTFSPFWVSTAPGADKIDIKFSVAPSSVNGQ